MKNIHEKAAKANLIKNFINNNSRKRSFFMITTIVICIVFISILVSNKINANNVDIYRILIDVEESKLYLFKNDGLQSEYRCAGGKDETPSPIGTWEIIKKEKWGESFGGSWMGFNVPWGEFGIHGTLYENSIGWSSSHGCIRMNNKDAKEVYNIVPIGTKVTIVDGVYGSFGSGYRNLKSGMYGSDVYQIQKKLKELGFLNAIPNGSFGNETEKAIKKYCAANYLYIRKVIDAELQKHMGFYLMD